MHPKWQRTAGAACGSMYRSSGLCRSSLPLNGAVAGGDNEGQINPTTSYIVSYDGAIANNARARCRVCLSVALAIWPDLSTENESFSWALNKMEALVPAMSNDGTDRKGLSVMVDLVMLARLILEEQQLDDGRNSGRGGKYGSKYHPQQQEQMPTSSVEEAKDGSSKSVVGSRPLTVGEIAANWLDGGCLRDTIRVKYSIDKKDPFPIIRRAVEECCSDSDDLVTKTSPNISPGPNLQLLSLLKKAGEAVIVLDHECRKSEALTVVKDTFTSSMPHQIVAPSVGEESELDIIRSLIAKIDDDCGVSKRICIIHNSLSLLERLKTIFGGDSPRLQGGYAKVPNSSLEIGLFLPAWSDCTSPQQENGAILDPWLNVMDEDDLVRLAEQQAEINAWE